MTILAKTLKIGAAATASAIGLALASAPAQASFSGSISGSGDAQYDLDDYTVTLTGVKVSSDPGDATGIFAGFQGTSVVTNHFLQFISPDGSYLGVDDFFVFNKPGLPPVTISFNLAPGKAEYFMLGGTAFEVDFAGSFYKNLTEYLGEGTFSVSASTTGTSFSFAADAHAKPVPEPFTIMGAAVALGFGAYSKRKFKTLE